MLAPYATHIFAWLAALIALPLNYLPRGFFYLISAEDCEASQQSQPKHRWNTLEQVSINYVCGTFAAVTSSQHPKRHPKMYEIRPR
jgi:hypothetical protein